MSNFNFLVKYESALVHSMRFVLGVMFIWFGTLKILGHNPVFELVSNSITPFLALGGGLMILGAFEVFIGILLLVRRVVVLANVILILHLLGTFSTFLFGWDIVFDPYFPILSLGGEFVVKNIVLILAALMVLAHESKKSLPARV